LLKDSDAAILDLIFGVGLIKFVHAPDYSG